jgi:tRNA pseudouridine38-40 synthase
MYTYKLLIAYDGTSYWGWQQQPNHKTVQEVLQKQFVRVFNRSITLFAASRTDAGVHALGQVVSCTTDLYIDPAILKKAWNGLLPPDIHLRDVQFMPNGFRSQMNVVEKTYDYYVFKKRPLPFMARYGWYHPRAFDPEVIKNVMNIFVGTHDFHAFCANGEKYTSTVRTVTSVDVQFIKRLQAYRIRVKGPGFLRYMIRRMVGAALYAASHPEYPIEKVKKSLDSKIPDAPLVCAPPQGLVLRKIVYGNDHQQQKN